MIRLRPLVDVELSKLSKDVQLHILWLEEQATGEHWSDPEWAPPPMAFPSDQDDD